MGKVFLILRISGILCGGAVAIVSLLLPQLTRNVSMSEASIGIIAGGRFGYFIRSGKCRTDSFDR